MENGLGCGEGPGDVLPRVSVSRGHQAFLQTLRQMRSALISEHIPLTLEISTDAQSLIGFGVICEGYICQQLVPVGCYLRGALLSRAGT